MGGKLTEHAYRELIDGDLEWLSRFKSSEEAQHIRCVLINSIAMHYPPYRDELEPTKIDKALHFNCHNMYVPPEKGNE